MILAALEYPLDAVDEACARFRNGEIDGHDNRFPPTVPQLVAQFRFMDRVLAGITRRRGGDGLISYRMGEEPPPGTTPLGPIKAEIGGRVRDISHLTYAEKMAAIETGKMPEDAPAQIEARVVPQLRRMGE